MSDRDDEAAGPRPGRFLRVGDVAAELGTTNAQVYVPVRREELVGMKIGGRGQWRVEREELERYVART